VIGVVWILVTNQAPSANAATRLTTGSDSMMPPKGAKKYPARGPKGWSGGGQMMTIA
jgi:hypothetical protein